ncbi:flagellin [Pseudoxanthomonas winnipegensis]|jgi:flagellin|uniref:Flagellin n=1 Tax=Pseudoxanthomonas winnipegensis TaxID=2480810 RepID=A0ABY1WIB2_9GAMM|nr:flagellin [Pseudoxanthomonas winnipegensis]TAA10168.1 flagellin [Pseudoxanthomonas winnipegensis]TAA22451.1 flagellin [Pseudoxanthomonas winnipegensis]TAH70077.1 flagellin [Pseudoxanthomonas winnipegensis]
MSSVINTNVSSLNAQRNLTASSSDLATAMQRLSSGLRINSAKDDAAGLAISQRMTAQIRGLDQAARNANDGISLAQTAEGALSAIGDNLQRIRELAVQSANATNNSTDRAALDLEAQALKDEIDRVATSTKFNGVNLLDGSFTAQAFQVGANVGDTISIASIANATKASLGGTWTSTTYTADSAALTYTDAAAATSVTINGVAVSIAAASGRTAAQAATAFKSAFNTAKASNTALANVSFDDATGKFTVTGQGSTATFTALTNAGGVSGTTTAAATSVSHTGLTDLKLTTAADANDAINLMDTALASVNTARANMGAIQNRFSSVVSNLSTTSENLSAARSRIQDTDYAAESAKLTRNQILQQAGTAMLAQANQSAQSVLKLIS